MSEAGESRGQGYPRTADLWGLAFAAMRQQKVRTTLTLVGIVVGTFALAMSLAVGRGIDRAIVALFQKDNRLRKIWVFPFYQDIADNLPADRREPTGTMSDAKRERLRKAIRRSAHMVRQRVTLNQPALDRFAGLDHVTSALPIIHLSGDLRATLDGKSEEISAASVMPDSRFFADRLIAGRIFAPSDGKVAIVHEYLLYRWGLISDAEVESVLGRKFRMEMRREAPDTVHPDWILRMGNRDIDERQVRALDSALRRLARIARFLPLPADERQVLREMFERISATSTIQPAKTIAEEFTIVGVLRERAEKDAEPSMFGEWGMGSEDILLPVRAARDFVLRIPDADEVGFDGAVVTVDEDIQVKGVADRIKATGFGENSLADFIAVVRLNVLLISTATAFIAVVALIVAAIGITNTMIMSVLERMREIGVMKAVGARDGDIRFLFVVEGTLMGLVGSGLGMALSLLSSIPADRIARSILEPQTPPALQGLLDAPLLAFPHWLVLGVPALVCTITTLAAWYPASRAARVDPVTSLRHE
ncbi:MAG: ABC transporter permease [Isosphaeraceae bacterium]